MSIKISDDIKKIIEDKQSVAVVSAIGKNGFPYSQKTHKILVKDNGQIAIYELLEKSQIQKNLVFSLWFSKEVSLLVVTSQGKSFYFTLKPYRALEAGHEFTNEYNKILSEFGSDADLSTVWLFDVENIEETTYEVEHEKEKKEHPYLYHMDHIVKEEFR